MGKQKSIKSRAITAEEAREKFLRHCRNMATYWASLPDKTPQERCDGLVFSLLNVFDGNTLVLPAIDMALAPHPDDKAFAQGQGENYYRRGMVINACQMHEAYCALERADDEAEAQRKSIAASAEAIRIGDATEVDIDRVAKTGNPKTE